MVNLYINAPDTGSSGRTRTYVADAGEATLYVEVRDSTTGAVLGRVADRRIVDGGGPASRASNKADFGAQFRSWAKLAVEGLEELKSDAAAAATAN